MNIALIFAGGVGRRMNNSDTPKQFLKVNDKEILVYTLEMFQHCSEVDKIILVSLKEYIPLCQDLCKKYSLDKVTNIIEGGITGQESIYNGLVEAKNISENFDKDIVLIHDGVRPIITNELISNVISATKKYGNAIPVTEAVDTIAINSKEGKLGVIQEREKCTHAKAPQTFFLKDILKAHEQSKQDKKVFIDSASMMQHYGKELYTVPCSADNIKITTPIDFYVFKGLIENITK